MNDREKAILWLNSFIKNNETMTLIPRPLIRLMYAVLNEKDHPKERKKQTNADKYFRNATDEEIASFLAAVNNHRQWSEQTLMQDLDADYAYYLEWLKEVPNAELD